MSPSARLLKGNAATLLVCNTDSLGEQIQRAFPTAKVVKTLNTVTSAAMVEPSIIPGVHTMFVSGNDAKAKAEVINILKTGFGWKEVMDLGDIGGARAQEMLLALWVRLYMKLQTPNVNGHVARKRPGQKPIRTVFQQIIAVRAESPTIGTTST